MLKKILETEQEILKWNKILGQDLLKKKINEQVKTDIEKIIYENSDGKSAAEIGKIAGVSHQTVINYWRRWFAAGVVQPSDKFVGRFERFVSLKVLGIDLPSKEKAQTTENITSNEGGTDA